jgi:tetratricopeptide (TPR) repeat protein
MGDSYSALAKDDKKYYQNAIESYSKAIAIEPTYREPYLNMAKAYLAIKDYALAEFMLKRGIERSYRHYTWLERDTSWTYEPWDLLCLAAYYGGHKKDSIAYAAKALSFEPNNKRLQKNVELCIDGTDDKELL